MSTETHGTEWGYRSGCREECCRSAHARKRREERSGKLADAWKTCQSCGARHRGRHPKCWKCIRSRTWTTGEIELTGGQWRLDPVTRVQKYVREEAA